jgi:hypothetical protein
MYHPTVLLCALHVAEADRVLAEIHRFERSRDLLRARQ